MNETSLTPMPATPMASKHTVYIVALVILGIALAAVSVFAYAAASDASEARASVAALEVKLSSKEGESGAAKEEAEAADAMALYMADKFDELDTILLDTDTNAVDFIAWVYDNATFENLPEAQARYDAWEREQFRTNEAYEALNTELEAYFADYGVDLNVQVQ